MERYYGPLLGKDEYFSTWIKEELANLSEEHKTAIYNEYKTRHVVFNRDRFSCVVEGCNFKESPLTLHHFRHKSNGGKTSPRNCITVCRAHQNHYHTGKAALKYAELDCLPNHIKGATQAHDTYARHKNGNGYTVDYVPKTTLYTMRQVRKQHKDLWGKPLSWEQILLLMTFLFSNESWRMEYGTD